LLRQRSTLALIVVRTPFQCLQVIPGLVDPACEYGTLSPRILIGMKPSDKKRHITSQFAIARSRVDPKDAIAVGIRAEQHFLNEKDCRLPY
jgi:hypothetical protein